ncbi:hypothetical protein Tamer19_38380 [Cupriavidus sp. TA19]|nr:hypothetical protein Tamer19_38380 [Cupriavidus sp. TA19]
MMSATEGSKSVIKPKTSPSTGTPRGAQGEHRALDKATPLGKRRDGLEHVIAHIRAEVEHLFRT